MLKPGMQKHQKQGQANETQQNKHEKTKTYQFLIKILQITSKSKSNHQPIKTNPEKPKTTIQTQRANPNQKLQNHKTNPNKISSKTNSKSLKFKEATNFQSAIHSFLTFRGKNNSKLPKIPSLDDAELKTPGLLLSKK